VPQRADRARRQTAVDELFVIANEIVSVAVEMDRLRCRISAAKAALLETNSALKLGWQ